jgi:hypothetical protein
MCGFLAAFSFTMRDWKLQTPESKAAYHDS